MDYDDYGLDISLEDRRTPSQEVENIPKVQLGMSFLLGLMWDNWDFSRIKIILKHSSIGFAIQ